ncbi:MAG: AzlD domain-containing protein [Gammaproteobacteria bacterium]|jgi:branched-subunit amino acid transport protein|nr:AzlD domain-containing protein [Gammaproteobacteria bacterium]
MSETALWLTILGAGFGTWLLRLSFIETWQWLSVPPLLDRALRYVPAAVMAALVVPALVRPESVVDLSPDNLRLLAGIVAALVAWLTRNVLLTLAVGMGVLWALQGLG